MRRIGVTCRCNMCGSKSAGTNRCHRQYARVGLSGDERAVHGADKRQTRQLRRRRENVSWRREERICA